MKKKKDKLSKSVTDYKEFYRNSIDLETYLLSNSQYMGKLKNNKKTCVIVLILTIIAFILSILEKNLVFFVIFIILVIICVLMIHESFVIMQKITENHRNKVSSYVGVNAKLRSNKNTQDRLKEEINELNKKIKDMENDIRFYDNLLNNR